MLRSSGAALFIAGEDSAATRWRWRRGRARSGESTSGSIESLGALAVAGGARHLRAEDRTIVAADVSETTAPRFLQRKIRFGPGLDEAPTPLGFTPARQAEYIQEQSVFLRRHRMGRCQPAQLPVTPLPNWWDRYGSTIPSGSNSRNGRRGPNKPSARFSMCVSNPGAAERQIVALWKKAGRGGRLPQRLRSTAVRTISSELHLRRVSAWDGPRPRTYRRIIDHLEVRARVRLGPLCALLARVCSGSAA